MFETLRQWDRPGEPVARLVRQFGKLIDDLELAIQHTYSERAFMVDTLHSLRVDFQELLSHLPEEEQPTYSERASMVDTLHPLSVDLVGLIKRMSAEELKEICERTSRDEEDTPDHARLEQLRMDVNDRLSHLRHSLSGGADLAEARRMLAQLRKEGMSCLQVGLA